MKKSPGMPESEGWGGSTPRFGVQAANEEPPELGAGFSIGFADAAGTRLVNLKPEQLARGAQLSGTEEESA